MLDVGQFNQLTVLEKGTHGAILDGGDAGRLLLPLSECPKTVAPGDQLNVFVYLDALRDAVPTTRQPAAQLGQVAWLEVVDVTDKGAFVDWGLPKDLFIPFGEQQHPLKKAHHTLVKVYLDNVGRLAGSTRIDHWINDDPRGLKLGEKVSLIVADQTELGFKAVINHECWGLLYANELYRRVKKGQSLDGYVKRIRDDGKVDLSLSPIGFSKDKIESVTDAILASLEKNDGFLALTDKSPPPEIYAAFGVSKKVFKQATGALYKQRRITFESAGIRLV
ncbi:MAG: putative RNA-binding protein (virulence factor B family) [Halioglobus sp.]|jgi:predicted RNA-binding protein (virulence factor B family)